MEQRAERAVDEGGRLVELELAHVALAELEVDAGLGRALAGAGASIAGEESIPMHAACPVSRATGIATRPLPTASSTSGPSASRASST